MHEIIDRRLTAALKRYPDCVIDYIILADDQDYRGLPNHLEAAKAAIGVLNERAAKIPLAYTLDTERMCAAAEKPEDFFAVVLTPWRENDSAVRRFTLPNPLNYYLAFLEPPHGTTYTQKDFNQLNKILFPHGINQLKIYRFIDDFSSYFDAGKEW